MSLSIVSAYLYYIKNGVSVMTVFVLIRSFIIEFKNDTGLILKYIY